VDLYRKVKALGADLVFRMMDRTFTQAEAEDLMEKLMIIEDTVREVEDTKRKAEGNK